MIMNLRPTPRAHRAAGCRVWLALSLALIVIACGGKKGDDKAKPQPKPTTKPATDKPYPTLKRDKISQLVISWGKHTIAIDRGTPHWRVTTPFKDKASPRGVAAILRELERMELGHQPVTTDSAAWAKYTLSPEQVVTLYVTHAGTKLPPIHLGDKNYVRIGDNPAVYSRIHVNRYTFGRLPREWRDRQLLRFDAEATTALEAQDDKGRTLIAKRTPAPPAASKKAARQPDTWSLSKGKKLVPKLNQDIPNNVFRRLQTLEAVDVAGMDKAAAGLTKPLRTFVIHVGTKRHALHLGKTEAKHVFASVDDSARVWKLRGVDVKLLNRDLASWGKPL